MKKEIQLTTEVVRAMLKILEDSDGDYLVFDHENFQEQANALVCEYSKDELN